MLENGIWLAFFYFDRVLFFQENESKTVHLFLHDLPAADLSGNSNECDATRKGEREKRLYAGVVVKMNF